MNNLKALIEKYETAGPRYTSYPTAPHFTPDADKGRLRDLALMREAPLSLYIHIPFCASQCWFCGCSSSVCTQPEKIDAYLQLLRAELELWRDAGLNRRQLRQIHFGGGTPNILEPAQISELGAIIKKYFSVHHGDCEFSVEFDPRTLSPEKISSFAQLGVNRASMGIQDTCEDVQKAVNRIQPQSMNLEVARQLRLAGIDTLNIDIMYGLPLQTQSSFANTVKDALDLQPDRIALFGYAHVPWVKASQKILERYKLPSPAEKLSMFLYAKSAFEDAGYEYIGLDHFAKPSDPLIEARKNSTLHRNFQGYSTHAGIDTFAIGLTSISETKTSYRQNYKDMQLYARSISDGSIPIERGIILNGEDILRRGIIMDVMCSLKVGYFNYGVDFAKKFESVFPKLEEMRKDGLVDMYPDRFEVTPLGRLFLRNIAMLFDGRMAGERYSKTI